VQSVRSAQGFPETTADGNNRSSKKLLAINLPKAFAQKMPIDSSLAGVAIGSATRTRVQRVSPRASSKLKMR